MRTVQLILAPVQDGDAWRTLDVRSAGARGPSRILVAPGALILSRDVAAMGRTDAQARTATLLALAPELAQPAADCVCALGPVRDGRRSAHVIARHALDALVARAKAQGHTPEAIIADFAVLPSPQAGEAVVARRGDILVRTEATAFACQPDVAALLLGQRAVHEIDFGSAAIAFFTKGLQAGLPTFDILASKVAGSSSRAMPIAAGIAAAAALGVFAATPWIEAGRYDQATAGVRAEIDKVAREALPGAQRIINPLAQLREAGLSRAQAAAGLDTAVTVVEGLARSPGVSIARLAVDGASVITHVGVSNTALLQPLRDHLAARGLQLVETPGLSEPNNIPVELTVTRP